MSHKFKKHKKRHGKKTFVSLQETSSIHKTPTDGFSSLSRASAVIAQKQNLKKERKKNKV